MEAAGIDGDERVGRDGESPRLRQAELAEFAGVYSKRPALRQAVAVLYANAPRLLPGEPLRGQPMGAGDISQGTLVVRDVCQEEPGLERGMEGVGVKLELRIRGPGRVSHRDGLHVVKGLAAGACHVGEK